jgi:hypothetical protein
MTENIPNEEPKPNELNTFKEEILRKMREFETKITSQIENKELTLNGDYQTFTTKINLLMNNNKEMISTITSQKVKFDKISELESFKNKTDDMLITHEIRIKNNMDEIEKIKTKYDKIISDNLYVSGYIGTSCQFRNLSEYLSFNIAEVSRLKMEKDQLKKEIKEIKGKFESIMKAMVTMNDNTVKLCNNYTETKQEYFQILLNNAIKEVNQKSLDMRVVMQKFQNDSDQKLVELREEVNRLIKSESNLNNLVNDNFYICEKQHEEMKKNISNGDEKISTNKKNLSNLDDKVQDLQNRIKLTEGLYPRVRKLNDMVESLSKLAGNMNFNAMTKTISQSPPPKKNGMMRKNSNPDLIKLTTDNTNEKSVKFANIENAVRNNIPKKLLGKSVRNNEIKKFNLNLINNVPSIDESTKIKESEEKGKKVAKLKINITDDFIDTSSDNRPLIIINESKKEQENKKDQEKDKEKSKEIEKEKVKSKEIEKEIEKPQKQNKNNNSIQTLPILTLNGKRNNSKSSMLKLMENENDKNNNLHINNVFTVISNDMNSQHQMNFNNSKIKKIGTELEQEAPGCKVVSLRFSANEDKNNLSKSRRPPKVKYDIVNTLINDYRAKLFAKAHSPEAVNDINNEILEMPKRVSQAFGRTVHTFYFKKDAVNNTLANKNMNNFGLNGPKKGYNFKSNLKEKNENNSGNNINLKK